VTTFQHGFKCLECNLHFHVYSWNEVWPTDDDVDEGQPRDPGPFCPGCGKQTYLQFEPIKLDGEIFEYVPGGAKMIGHTFQNPVTNPLL